MRIGSDGTAMLSSGRVSVSQADRYRVEIKLLEDDRVVAEEIVRYPH